MTIYLSFKKDNKNKLKNMHNFPGDKILIAVNND